MKRKIIKIEESLCNGCGKCAKACHEGAIKMIDGVAKLTRDDYCDGLGDCLPECPTGAISFEVREALAYDEEAVKQNQAKAKQEQEQEQGGCSCSGGCPGSQAKEIKRDLNSLLNVQTSGAEIDLSRLGDSTSQLRQWPVQIKLAPVNAPYFNGADLLIAADCTAYAYGDFHNKFIKGKVVLIGCPKLDEGDYSEKLTAIIKNNDIKSVTLTRMEVPCCGGIESALKTALQNSGKFIPWQVVTISNEGRIL